MTLAARRRPICMIVHAYYEEDSRVRREAETLVAAGWEVDVFGLRRPGETASATVEGVNVRRLPVGRHQGAGLSVYLVEYGAFLVRALLAATRAHRRRRYGLVEVHSLPDYLVFAALPMKLAGVPVLLDLHEAMPEFFRSRFPRAANPITYRLLRLQEKLSIALANEVLTVNEPLADRLRSARHQAGPSDRHPEQPGPAALRRRSALSTQVHGGRKAAHRLYGRPDPNIRAGRGPAGTGGSRPDQT